jgi:hypothetical protein
MFPKHEHITKEGFTSFVKGWPTALVVSMYCISKYHEKWNLTEWCLRELVLRGYTKADMGDFDSNFENFYHQVMVQEDL